MAKKHAPNSAADDLIKSLLDDVKDDEATQAPAEEFNLGENNSPFLDQGPEAPSAIPKNEDVPDGLNLPPPEKEGYDGPSLRAVYQLPSDLEATAALNKTRNFSASPEDKTYPLPSPLASEYAPQAQAQVKTEAISDRIVQIPKSGTPSMMTHLDASLIQAENLKMAQQRILDLEQEVDRIRAENEEIAAAAEVIRARNDEVLIRIQKLEKDKNEIEENAQSEIQILKGQLAFKETEVGKTLQKIEELEIRLKNDFRKVRVRERELENRLELVKAEKTAVVRSKDENILELKRKIDQFQHEIDNYREKCLDLNKTLDSHKEQFKRTVRALKLALTNLEVKDDEVIGLKKAE